MSDKQTKLARLVELMQNHEDAIPYLVGYLGFHLSEELIGKAVDSYLAHDEELGIMQVAQRLAQENARLHPQM